MVDMKQQQDPYEVSSLVNSDEGSWKPISIIKLALIGAVLGSILPVCMGVYALHMDAMARAEFPNGLWCGNTSIMVWNMILFIGPTCSAIGAGILAALAAWTRKRRSA